MEFKVLTEEEFRHFIKDNSFMSGWFENEEELIYNVFVVMTIKDDFSDFKDRRGKSWRE